MMADLSPFRFSHPIAVRFADLDALGHVNNATVVTYMETARVHYMREALGWDGNLTTLAIVIARVECDYRAPIQLGDAVRVYLRTSRLGRSSFDFTYAITAQRGSAGPVLAAEGRTVQVAFDYARAQPAPLPDAWRRAALAFEPALDA